MKADNEADEALLDSYKVFWTECQLVDSILFILLVVLFFSLDQPVRKMAAA